MKKDISIWIAAALLWWVFGAALCIAASGNSVIPGTKILGSDLRHSVKVFASSVMPQALDGVAGAEFSRASAYDEFESF